MRAPTLARILCVVNQDGRGSGGNCRRACAARRGARRRQRWRVVAAPAAPAVRPAALPPESSRPRRSPARSQSCRADGRTAIPPAAAPEPVKQAIYAANRITRKPYLYGGGHRSFRSRGYDCSGSVSYALHGGGLLDSPLHSSAFMRWGERGPGQWITVFTNPGHAYVVIAGLRFDTSGPGERGPRWRTAARSTRRYYRAPPRRLLGPR